MKKKRKIKRKKKSNMLIPLVNTANQIIGLGDKYTSHRGEGVLHRALSVWIFSTDKKKVLLQKRSSKKMLFGGLFTNTCCTHPLLTPEMKKYYKTHTGIFPETEDEKIQSYIHTSKIRLQEEIGCTTDLQYIGEFQYSASWKNQGSENEWCAILIGYKNHDISKFNPEEIEYLKYVDIIDLEKDMNIHPKRYSPWSKIEWKKIKDYCYAQQNMV